MSGELKRIKQESELASTVTCQDDEIEPLSGKPFFDVLLSKTHVNSPFHLGIPSKFTRILPYDTVPVILTCGRRSWEMAYLGNHPTHKRLDTRWRTFVADNMLKVGDACVFELLGCTTAVIKFKVQILRGDFPSVLSDREDGTSGSNPIVIDED